MSAWEVVAAFFIITGFFSVLFALIVLIAALLTDWQPPAAEEPVPVSELQFYRAKRDRAPRAPRSPAA